MLPAGETAASKPNTSVVPASGSAPAKVPVAFVKLSVAEVSVMVIATGVARVGAVLKGATAADALDALLVPIALVALTVKV